MNGRAPRPGAIFDNCPLKIESLALWGQKLLVGTSEGLLLIMGEVEEKGPRSRFAGEFGAVQCSFERFRTVRRWSEQL